MTKLRNSQEYSAIHIPDVNEVFKTVLAKRPVVASLIAVRGGAKNHKHEWLEYKKSQTAWVVDGDSAIASGALVLDSTVGVEADDILKFTKTTGGSVVVKAKVTSVTNATDLVITRLGTDSLIPDNAIVNLVSRAKNESSTGTDGTNVKPSRKFNYTQIFRRDLSLSETVLNTALYGLATQAEKDAKVEELVNFQIVNQLTDISFELNQSILDGYKEERVDGGANGSFGGMLPFLELESRSQYDAGAVAISQTILNNAIEQAVVNGANGTELTVMLCHPTQARKVSAFNSSGNNPVIVRGEVTAGSYVAQYQSDLGGTNGGALTVIIVDRNFPQDKVAIINPDNLSIVPMRNFSVTEKTDDDLDGRGWKLIGEITLEFKNASDEAMLIHNLAL